MVNDCAVMCVEHLQNLKSQPFLFEAQQFVFFRVLVVHGAAFAQMPAERRGCRPKLDHSIRDQGGNLPPAG